MLPIWLLAAMMIMMYYWRFWEPWANAMLAILLPKLWFWIENHDWHNSFWMSSWGSPLLDPKKLHNQQFYIIDWIRKKLLVDVANLATCCHDDYDVLLEVLGTLRECYVSSLLGLTTFPPMHARASGKRLADSLHSDDSLQRVVFR